jgi:hypothetical protein
LSQAFCRRPHKQQAKRLIVTRALLHPLRSWRPVPRRSKNVADFDFCDTYFRDKLGTEADALLYLRDRITRLRASHETSSADKYESFLQAIYIVAFLTIASIVLIASERRIGGTAKWASLTSTAALLVMVIIVAMGWLGKYRAEYAAQVELGILRDRIETEAAQSIATGQQITPAMVTDWTRDLSAIGRRFAENYGEATVIPEVDRFNQ